MQTGSVQPAHAPVPVVFRLLMRRRPEMYSTPGSSAASAVLGTATAAFSRAPLGPGEPIW